MGIGDAAFVLGRGGNRTATERGANAAAMIIKILLNRMGRDAFTRNPPCSITLVTYAGLWSTAMVNDSPIRIVVLNNFLHTRMASIANSIYGSQLLDKAWQGEAGSQSENSQRRPNRGPPEG